MNGYHWAIGLAILYVVAYVWLTLRKMDMEIPDCPECQGSGWIYDPNGASPHDGSWTKCQPCDGTGKVGIADNDHREVEN